MDPEKKEERREERRGTRRIRLLRSLILQGDNEPEHHEEDSVHDVARSLAHRLIGEGSAVAEDEGEVGDPGFATAVNRMEQPTSADPAPRRVSGRAPKVRE